MSLQSSAFFPHEQNMLEDLQIAAELGKTLLDRNKELQNIIKAHQSTIDEQAQEIEYMKKQTAALREVNDSRLKIYEELEVSIQDLERANNHLVAENTNDKKVIKSQSTTIENLEARCEDLQKKHEEITKRHESLVRQKIASESTSTVQTQTAVRKAMASLSGSIQQSAALSGQKCFQDTDTDSDTSGTLTNEKEITELLRQLREAQSKKTREKEKVFDLEQQLTILLQENNTLEEQLSVWRNKAQEVQNLQEEINTLEEVRRGQLCGRCLRGMKSKTHEDLFVMLNQSEYDDINVTESHVKDAQRDTESYTGDSNTKDGVSTNLSNPYKVLEEKYQALLEVQLGSTVRRKNSSPTACMSLQEELEMSGEFNSLQNPISEPEIQQESTKPINRKATRAKTEICEKKAFSVTPTEFSEADTVSSGFLDETSNKGTQTEERPGSFVCTIADGEDCKFSIYDDNSSFESRFRKTPEYRHLFNEIFSVLKKGAVAKDEKLTGATATIQRAESTSLVQEDVAGETTDHNQSVISSVLSSTVSEPICKVQKPIASNLMNELKSETPHANNKNEKNEEQQNENRLDDVSIGVKKKSSKKHASKKISSKDRSPDVVPTTNTKFLSPKLSGDKKKKVKQVNDTVCSRDAKTRESFWSDERSNTPDVNRQCKWQIDYDLNDICRRSREWEWPDLRSNTPDVNRQYKCQIDFDLNGRRYAKTRESVSPDVRSNTPDVNRQHKSQFEGEPCTVSETVAKLKHLEKSYADVLRMSNKYNRDDIDRYR